MESSDHIELRKYCLEMALRLSEDNLNYCTTITEKNKMNEISLDTVLANARVMEAYLGGKR